MKTHLYSTALVATLTVAGLAWSPAATAQQAQQQQAQPQQAQQQQGQPQQAQARQQGQMEYQQVRGTIRDVRQVNVRGSQQPATFVLLETEAGNRAVVDLGTERLNVDLQPGNQLAVRGRPVRLDQQRVILQANAIRYQGQTLQTNRPAQQAQAQQQAQQGQQQARTQLGPYDANNDAQFSPRELTQLMYSQFDYDNNGTLSIAEWDRGMDRYFGEGDINLRVSAWDENGNGRISQQEFYRALGQSGLYARIDADRSGAVELAEARREQLVPVGLAEAGAFDQWDRNQDAVLGRDEFATGLFDEWDQDQSGDLTENEFASQANDWVARWYGQATYSALDDDANDVVTQDEFTGGLGDAGVFDIWDEDDSGAIEQDEGWF